jgi:hypothetical protein
MASTEIEILDPAATVEKVKRIAAGRALNRRNFLAAFGMTGVAAGAGLMSGCNATTTSVPVTSASPAETNLLAFALNLEYLEATFYSFITGGADINLTAPANSGVSLVGSGAITGQIAGPVAFTGTNAQQTTDLLNEIYFDEWHHVAFLQSLLGSAVVARPAINLAAFGAITATNALALARLLEDVVVTAYSGAIPSLTTSNATYASQILGVESSHAGAMRLMNIQTGATFIPEGDPLQVIPFDPGTAALAAVGPTNSGGFFPTAGGEGPGMTPGRTTSQVLAIFFGAPNAPAASGALKGGFFPSGVNGTITAV